jgi:signal transduction histidine kinase
MKNRRLAEFILSNIEPILVAWENFARTIEPPALTMDNEALRDHAHVMLLAFAKDLGTAQSDQERADKSKGLAKRNRKDTAAEIHAEARLRSGYTAVQLVSEYRALRSSVLTLWDRDKKEYQSSDMTDMTRFNEAIDQALAESVARYERLVKQSQNMFLAILGHDLRNPLGTLVTGANFLMNVRDLPPKYTLMATRMFGSAKRMGKLINDLIDFTRTHLGPGIPIRAIQGDLSAICAEVVNELRTIHSERIIDLIVPPQLDAAFDNSRMAQLLSNLVGNALQHGVKDAPVSIVVSSRDDDITIAVNNKGPIIPAEKAASIFDPLVRLASNDTSPGEDETSLGIGLFISREIARAHGGQVDVSSSTTEGTTFTVTIPREQHGHRSTDSPRTVV